MRGLGRHRSAVLAGTSETRSAHAGLVCVLWSFDHEIVQWTCGVALDVSLGVLGTVRDAVPLELCSFARSQFWWEHLIVGILR